MLLDTYALAKSFEELLSLSPHHSSSPPPPSYIKRVQIVSSRLTPLLKTLQVRPSPPEALVQAYLIHIADKSDPNFRKVLDLKGIAKKDQNHLMDLFQAHKQGQKYEDLPLQSAFLTPLVITSSTVGPGTALNPLSAAGTNLGSVLMTAARDGVDRLGSPALGGIGGSGYNSSAGSRAVSPPPPMLENAAGNVNQNLRNIGKFFKRDLGGLGGRFGGGGSGVARANSDER